MPLEGDSALLFVNDSIKVGQVLCEKKNEASFKIKKIPTDCYGLSTKDRLDSN